MSDIKLGIVITADGSKAKSEMTGVESSLNKVGTAGKQAAASVDGLSGSMARLGAGISASRAATEGLQKLSGSAQSASRSVADMSGAWGKFSAAGARNLGAIQATGELSAALKKANSELSAAAIKAADLEKRMDGLGSMAKAAKTAIASMAAAFSAKALIQTADAYTNLTSKLKVVTGTTQEFSRAMTDVAAIANRYQADLSGVGAAYNRIAPLAANMGKTQKDVADALASVSASLKISGASTQETSETLRQFGQALSGPIIQMEEMNTIIDSNSTLWLGLQRQFPELIAQYGSLKEAIGKGAISNQELLEATIRLKDEFDNLANTMQVTVSGAMTVLNNEWTKYIGQADQAEGSSKQLSEAILLIANNLNEILEPIATVVGWITKIEVGGWLQFNEILHSINLNLHEMAGMKMPGGMLDAESLRLEAMGRGEVPISELAGATVKAGNAAAQAAPKFDGVNKQIKATGDAAKTAAGHLTALQKAQAQGAGLISTGSKYLGMGESNQSSVLVKFLNEYSGTTAKSIAGDVNAWCARFVSAVLNEAKVGGLPTMSAKAYANFGQGVWKQGMPAASLDNVMPGDIAIFTRKGGGGHVGFVKATDPGKGILDILGGNQSNQVSVIQKSMKDLIAVRRVTGGIKDFESAERAIEKERATYEKAVAAKKKAQDEAFDSLKLHQADAIKQAEDYAAVQTAKIKTSLAALNAEEAAQQQVTDAQLASAKTVDEKQAIIASAAAQSAAFHEAEKSLILAEIDLQQKALEAKRAAYVNELAGAQSGQYNTTTDDELAIKQAIRAVDTDLAQLAETKRQAEISAGAAVNQYGQQGVDLKRQEAGYIADAIATYERQVEVLNRLTAAKEAGASKEQLGMLNQYYGETGALPDAVSVEQLERMKQYKLSALAIGEAIKSLTSDMKDLKTPEQAVADEQLRMNKVWEDATQRMVEYAQTFEKAFGKMGKAVAGSAAALAIYEKRMRDIAIRKKEALEAAGTDVAKQEQAANEANLEVLMNTFDTLGNIAGAMQNMFDEGTAGYQAMAIAQQVFTMATQVANIALGIQAILNQGQGDWYSAIPRMIAMAGMVAGLIGSAVSMIGMGGGSSGTDNAESRQAAAGTGTVLGDASAKSESISNSLEIIRNNSSNDLSYSAKMLRALEGIEAAVSGATSSLFLFVNKSLAEMQIPQSELKNNKDLVDWGITFPAKELMKIIKDGLDEGSIYAQNVRQKKTTYTVADIADFGISDQFSKAIRGIAEALIEGGKAFGLSAADFKERLRKFVVDLGIMSFKDMTGDEVQKQISAVMSNLSDRMAKAFMPGLQAFQKVGEGYAETFWRVAEGINRANGEMERLGFTAVNYKDILNKQGDVAAEIARQTIIAQGQLAYGVRQYVDELTGSAEDIIDAYKQLVQASASMNTAGFGDTYLDRTMINAAGGLSAFVDAIQSFNDEFLTEAQRLAGDSASLTTAFARLGQQFPELFNGAVPATKDAFYALMQGIDQTTESGKKLFGALLQLSPAFADIANRIADIQAKYEDILNPFGKFGAQIKTIGDDFKTLIDDALAKIQATGPEAQRITNLTGQRDTLINGAGGQKDLLGQQAVNSKRITELEAQITEEQKKGNKASKKKIKEWQADISQLQSANSMLGLQLNAVVGKLQGLNAQIAQAIKDNDAALAGQLTDEKNRQLQDAATVMADTLANVFAEIQATLDAAQQRLKSALDYQQSLATQIANLQGQTASAELFSTRAAQASKAVNDYWAMLPAARTPGATGAGNARDTEEELRLLGEAQQAIMDEYNAQVALAQQAAQEQAKALQEGLQRQIDAINAATQVQVDAINERLQADIEAINAATEAAIKSQQKADEAVIKAQQKAFDKELDAIKEAQDVKIQVLQDEYDAAVRLQSAIKGLAEYARSLKLGAQATLSPEARLAEAQRQYQELLTKANAGDPEAMGKLASASDTYLEAAKSYYGSSSQYQNIFGGVQQAMESLGAMDATDPDSIQSRIDVLREAQAEELDRVRELQQEAIDQVREQQQANLDTIRKSANDQIEAAQKAAQAQIKALQDAAQAQIKALQDEIADLNDPTKNLAIAALKEATIAKLQALAEKAEETRREAAIQYEEAKAKAAEDMRKAAQMAQDQLSAIGLVAGFNSQQVFALNAIAQRMDPSFNMPAPVQAYAQGGYAQAGMALVGEQGPELVRFERPAQVLTASQTREALNGDSPKTFAALEAIKNELKAIVTTQSSANPQLIDRLAAIEDRLNKMERNQRLQA